jgi:hypothetical protein
MLTKLPFLRRWCAAHIAAVVLIAGGALPAPGDDAQRCLGDCDGNGTVTIAEVVGLVRIALGNAPAEACPTVDDPGIETLVAAVDNLLSGCPEIVTYQLTEGSLVVATLRSQQDVISIREPLTGTMTMRKIEPPPVKNTLFYFGILDVDFRGKDRIAIHASTGNLSASTQVFDDLSAFMPAVIDGVGVQLSGIGPRAAFPNLTQLELCGPQDPPHAVSCEAIRAGLEEGYSVTIFAEPQTRP